MAKVSELELQFDNYIHFQTNIIGKDKNLFIP